MRPFKGALCANSVPGEHDHLSMLARRGCIRRLLHDGPHRNALLEWESGDKEARRRICSGCGKRKPDHRLFCPCDPDFISIRKKARRFS